MNSSKLLIDESPLQVLPSLAQKIGLNEAIVLQQVHYWLRIAEKAKDKKKYFIDAWWTYGTYEQWQAENFPFWSVVTVGRIFRSLEEKKLLLSRQPDSKGWDHTKWYTIDYYQLETIDHINLIPSDVSDWNEREYQDDTNLNRNTETSSETSTEKEEVPNGTRAKPEKKGDLFDGMLHYANKRNGKADLGFLHEHLREMGEAFVYAAGENHTPHRHEQSKWIKIIKEWYEFGFTPSRITRAVGYMREHGLTIGGPESVTKIARDIDATVFTASDDGRIDSY